MSPLQFEGDNKVDGQNYSYKMAPIVSMSCRCGEPKTEPGI